MGRIAGRREHSTHKGGYFYFILLKKLKGYIKMKKQTKSLLLALLALVLAFAFVACTPVETPAGNGSTTTTTGDNNAPVQKTGVWESATYLENTELGEGAKTITVEVKADGQSVTFTVKTDKDTVGAALLEHGLIAGEEGSYGLYVKTVNGMLADYDVDQTYWAFYINGEYAMSGVDTTEIEEGATYCLERTK